MKMGVIDVPAHSYITALTGQRDGLGAASCGFKECSTAEGPGGETGLSGAALIMPDTEKKGGEKKGKV